MSYNQWLNLLKVNQFAVEVIDKPHFVISNGRNSFSAKIRAFSSNLQMAILLKFGYGPEGNTPIGGWDKENSEMTLSSLRVNILKKH